MAEVEWERQGPVLVITLNRPEQRNAIGGSMLRLLREAFLTAEDDDDIRAVVTTGRGGHFSVGADVSALAAAGTSAPGGGADRGGRDNGLRPLSPVGRQIDRLGPGRWAAEILDCTTPSIAAVEGAAAGGGLCLAALHDFRIAAPDTTFAAGFVAVGLAPEMGLSHLLPRLIGEQQTRRLLMANERLTGRDALRVGLVDALAEDGDVLGAAVAYAQRLASLPPLAVRLTSQLITAAGSRTYSQHLESEYAAQRQLFETSDHVEATTAFRERRAAAFTGR